MLISVWSSERLDNSSKLVIKSLHACLKLLWISLHMQWFLSYNFVLCLIIPWACFLVRMVWLGINESGFARIYCLRHGCFSIAGGGYSCLRHCYLGHGLACLGYFCLNHSCLRHFSLSHSCLRQNCLSWIGMLWLATFILCVFICHP